MKGSEVCHRSALWRLVRINGERKGRGRRGEGWSGGVRTAVKMLGLSMAEVRKGGTESTVYVNFGAKRTIRFRMRGPRLLLLLRLHQLLLLPR